jgi:FrmR/RcnR family transcriptional regulator, repressor of frmRAB operon
VACVSRSSLAYRGTVQLRGVSKHAKNKIPMGVLRCQSKKHIEMVCDYAYLHVLRRIHMAGRGGGILFDMSHTLTGKEKLIWRIRRIRGQVEAVERALNEEQDCSDLLQLITAARGAMSSLIVEVLEGHIREHVLDPKQKLDSEHTSAAEELIDVLRSYLK